MADERLQHLRRARDRGDLETQARLLRERTRAGELSEEQLALAAYLGDPGSQAVAVAPARAPEELPAWVSGLAELDSLAAARAALVAAESLLPRRRPAEGQPDPRLALERAGEWLACPCVEHAGQAYQAAMELAPPRRRGSPRPDRSEGVPVPGLAALAVHLCVGMRSVSVIKTLFDLPSRPASVDALLDGHERHVFLPVPEARGLVAAGVCLYAAEVHGEAELRQRIGTRLVPWALGLAD